MCICKQHVPVICTCTNIMLFFFKIGVKIKAIFKDSGSPQLCAYSYLYQDSLPPDIAAFIIYKVIILKLINLSIGEVGGGGLQSDMESCFSYFFISFLLMVNNLSTGLGFWNVPATSSLELPGHLIYDITCHAPQTV